MEFKQEVRLTASSTPKIKFNQTKGNINSPSITIGFRSQRAYIERNAVQIIIQNEKSGIIVIRVKNGSYYKLPGGGVETDEDHEVAAQREALEKTGCKIDIGQECIAVVEEWRNDLHQRSDCYSGKLIEDTGVPQLTDEEKLDGLQHEWLALNEVVFKMSNCQPTSELGKFILERDLFFVKTFAEGQA